MKPFIHISLEIDGKPMGLSLTREEIEVANQLMEENPEKYPDGEGLMQVLLDATEALKER